MGTPLPARWKLFLPFVLLAAMLGVALPSASAATSVQAPHVDGAPAVDGRTEDAFWADAHSRSLTFDGTLDDASSRTVLVRLAHNGTHLFLAFEFAPPGGRFDDDHLLVTFADADATELAAGEGDYLRYGYPATVSDRVWDGTAWVSDTAQGCASHGAAGREGADATWRYEFAKPLASGDTCDVTAAPGGALRVRFEFRENLPAPDTGHGDDFRWPTGSAYMDAGGNGNGRMDEVAAWGRLSLLAAGVAPEEDEDDHGDGDTGGGSPDPTNGTNGDDGPGDGDGEDGAVPIVPFGPLGVALVVLMRHLRTPRD